MRRAKLFRLKMLIIKWFVSCIFSVNNKATVNRRLKDLKFVRLLYFMFFLSTLLIGFGIRITVKLKDKWFALNLMEPTLIWGFIIASVGLILTFTTMWYNLKAMCEERVPSLKLGQILTQVDSIITVVAAGIVIFFVFFSTPRTKIFLQENVAFYRHDPERAHKIDIIQKSFQCCGATSYTDYYERLHLVAGTLDYCSLPKSCSVSNAVYEREINKHGCLKSNPNMTVEYNGSTYESEYSTIYEADCLSSITAFMLDLSPDLLIHAALMLITQIVLSISNEAQRASLRELPLTRRLRKHKDIIEHLKRTQRLFHSAYEWT